MRTAICEYTLLVLGLLIFALGFAHSLAGWPPLEKALTTAGIDPQISGALQVGWLFGSGSMHAFGILVVLSFFSLRKGIASARQVPIIVGLLYLIFGASASLFRHFNAHFAIFMALGVLLLFAALAWMPRLRSPGNVA